MGPQEVQKWEQTRQKGITRYILKYGSILALGYAYLAWFFTTTGKTTGFDVAGIAFTSILGGIAMSVIFWYRKEIPYQYTKHKRSI